MKQITGTIAVVWAIMLLCGAEKICAQQNIQFTQYMFNSISVNPAYSGYKEEWFAQLGLRNQWVGIEGAPKTGSLSIDGLVDPYGRKLHGVGLQLLADRIGPQSSNSAYLNYAFRLQLNNEDTQRLNFGIGIGVTQYILDGGMLNPIDSRDPAVQPNRISNVIPDARFGIYYHTEKWYVGASVMDLMSGYQNNDLFRWDNVTTDNIRRKRHVYLMGGMLIDLDDRLKLRPSLLIKEDFRGPTSFDLNAMFIFDDRFWIGAGWRTGVAVFKREYNRLTGDKLNGLNSVSAIAQLYATGSLRIGYSYDYIISRLSGLQNGSHEITLGFTFGRKDGRRLLSPRFF